MSVVASKKLNPGTNGLPPAAEDSLRTIAVRLQKFREARDWQRFHTPHNLAMSIAVECGELLEHFQWVGEDELLQHLEQREQDVAEELADIAIYVIQLADTLGVSLSEAVDSKISRNEERYPIALSRGRATKHTALRASED